MYFTVCINISATVTLILSAFCASSSVANEMIAEKCILYYLFSSVESQTDSLTSFSSLLNSSTSSFSIFRSSLLWNILIRSSCSTILCHFLFSLIWVKLSFGSHIVLCFSKSLAVFSSAVVITILTSVLNIVTVTIRTFSIFAAFKALLIVSL